MFTSQMHAISPKHKLGWICILTLLIFSTRVVATAPTLVIKDGVWEQIVFPTQSDSQTLRSLIGDDLNPDDYDSNWVVWAYEADGSRYTKVSLDDTIETGHAYWIVQHTGGAVELDVPPEVVTQPQSGIDGCVSNDGCLKVGVPTVAGGSWSLRGSPYPGPLSMGSLRVVTPVASAECETGYDLDRGFVSGVMSNQVFHYDSDQRAYIALDTESSIGAWSGFWIRSLSDSEGPISLVFPAPVATELHTRLLDDFCVDTLAVGKADPDDSDAIRSIEFMEGIALASVETLGSERKWSRIRLTGVGDSVFARMALRPGSVYEGTGRAGASIGFEPYNSIADGGNGDGQSGDVGFYLRIGFQGNGYHRFAFGAYRHEGGIEAEDYLVLDGWNFRIFENLTPQLGVFYRLGIAVDRLDQTVTFSVDDTSLTYDLPTALFYPASPYLALGARADRGPATAVVAIDEVGGDDVTIDFSGAGNFLTYNASDRDRRDVSIDVQDGEVRLESISSGSNADARLRVTGVESSYGSAAMRLSSDSVVADSGQVTMRIGGPLYYASENPAVDGLLDMVFAITEIVMDENGGLEARYCAWQSHAADFSVSTSLTNPASDSGCASFSVQPQLDQNHIMATWLDMEQNKIGFSIDGEQHYVSIGTPISLDESLDLWLQARSTGAGSRVVAFADNLRVVDRNAGSVAITNGRINTLEQFQATIVGRTLVQREADGVRDETTALIANSDGTVTGTFDGGEVFINWYWDGDLYCRSGTGGPADAPFDIELQCQVVTIALGVVTFANSLDASDARSYFVE